MSNWSWKFDVILFRDILVQNFVSSWTPGKMGFQLIGWMDGLNSKDGWISEFNVTFTQASAQQTWEPAQQMI